MKINVAADGVPEVRKEQAGSRRQCCAQQDQRVCPEFLVQIIFQRQSGQGAEMQNEIASAQKHEDNEDQLYIGTLVKGNAVILVRKTAGGDGAERMAYSIKQRHSAEKEQQRFQQGQSQIDQPQDFGGAGNPRREMVVARFDAGNFRIVQGLSADSQNWQDRQ